MYTINAFQRHVRDAAAPYGGGWQERESFPAEGVLRDLRPQGSEAETRRIVARYCVTRYVLLREADEPPELVSHARDAALEHLRLLPRWAEGVGLRRLVERGGPAELALSGLSGVAADAEAAGHLHGALAALRSAYAVARRRRQHERAAGLARDVGAFLRRRGEEAQARAWESRARQVARLARGGAPPDAG